VRIPGLHVFLSSACYIISDFGILRVIIVTSFSIMGYKRETIHIFLGGGCMSESDISDITPIIKSKIKGRCFYELQPRNSKNPI
jgi:hypothetical protein